jgi:hypothetical protein
MTEESNVMKVQDQEVWQQLPTQRNMAGEPATPAPAGNVTPIATTESRAEAMYGTTQTETDTDNGTPDDAGDLGAGDDDTPAVTDADEGESDTDDSTPDETEAEEATYEKRYKDLQAEFTERTQELSQLKTEMAESQAEVTRTAFELQDRYAEQEQMAGFLLNGARGELQRLQQVNVQALNQQQYAQWQQAIAAAGQKAQQVTQAFEQIKARAKQVRDNVRSREATIARATLTRSIDNFDDAYPKIGQYAVSEGVNPQVFREITDPGLIKIIHKAMSLTSQPDVIKKVITKQQSMSSKAQVAKSRTPAAQPKTLAEKMYPTNIVKKR